MIIDMFTHICPIKYRDAMRKYLPADDYRVASKEYAPSLTNVDLRLQFMDVYGSEYVQVLTNQFFAEEIVGPKESPELASIGNDAIAEIIAKYPDRFIGGAANLSMNNIEVLTPE